MFLYVAFVFLELLSMGAEAYVSIDIGKAQIRESQMAIQPLVLKSTPSRAATKAGSIIYRVLESNLAQSGSFKIIEQESFLEKPGEKKLEPYPKNPDGFIWKNWQLLKTDYLLLGAYTIINGFVDLDLYLYHVPLKRKIFQKKYSASINLAREMGFTICNDVIKILTKKPGIFFTKIVATRTMSGSKKELFIMNWNGEKKKRISFHQSNVLSPSWSIDGKKILYTAYLYRKKTGRRRASLLLYNRADKNRQIISTKGGAQLGSHFMPDGQHVLLSLFLGRGNMDIAKMSLKDGVVTPLTRGPYGTINVEPVAHPRGKNILFSSDRGGKVMIYSMNPRGKNIKPITWQGSYNSTPDYSPDGKRVIFSGRSQGRFDIFIMAEDGSKLRRLTSAKKNNGKWANNESPSFAPDGLHIVFTSDRSGKYQLYIMNLSTSRITQITTGRYQYKSPKWSPLL